MSYYVLRQIHPHGLSARADQSTAAALALAAVEGRVVHGAYLEWSDPNARNGFGDDRWTNKLAKAKRFATFEAAMACWQAQSTKRPLRDDGKPNRPMTAYSVTPERIDE
jgi:hypothetical protein